MTCERRTSWFEYQTVKLQEPNFQSRWVESLDSANPINQQLAKIIRIDVWIPAQKSKQMRWRVYATDVRPAKNPRSCVSLSLSLLFSMFRSLWGPHFRQLRVVTLRPVTNLRNPVYTLVGSLLYALLCQNCCLASPQKATPWWLGFLMIHTSKVGRNAVENELSRGRRLLGQKQRDRPCTKYPGNIPPPRRCILTSRNCWWIKKKSRRNSTNSTLTIPESPDWSLLVPCRVTNIQSSWVVR